MNPTEDEIPRDVREHPALACGPDIPPFEAMRFQRFPGAHMLSGWKRRKGRGRNYEKLSIYSPQNDLIWKRQIFKIENYL